jgi:acyl-CoA synthetase (AMP-forming)/AMP-acid ligase II
MVNGRKRSSKLETPTLDPRDVNEGVVTLPALMRRAVECFGEREAVVTLEERVTFADLDLAARQLAASFAKAGVGKGTRVGAQFSYGADWLVAFLAATRVGGVFVPLSTAYKPAELRKVVRHSDIAVLVSPQQLFGSPRVPYLEAAFPELASQRAGRLWLEAAPYLRAVWLDRESGPGWATTFRVRDGLPDASRGADQLRSAGQLRSDGADPASGITSEILESMADEVAPSDAAVSIYTSGTTAEPKGVIHSHGALVRKGFAQVATKASSTEDRVFCGMPFFWVGGLVQGVMGALVNGSTLLCLERPEPSAALDLMEREQATHIIGWPGVTGPIMSHPGRASRSIPALAKPPYRRAGLGMTETLAGYSSSASVTAAPQGERGACMGIVNEGVEVKVVDPATGRESVEGGSGAILVRGYSLMLGIHKHEREETFTPDGWYDTGDKGYLKDGLLFFEGRYKEMIKTSGNNVAPPEVEGVLQSFPEVAEAHVLGVPDEQRGEIVAAAIVPAPGFTIDKEALQERARQELSNYKVPRKIVVLDQVPLLATGKPDRLAIRELLVGS